MAKKESIPIIVAFIISGAMMIYGMWIESYYFRFGGLLGYLIAWVCLQFNEVRNHLEDKEDKR